MTQVYEAILSVDDKSSGPITKVDQALAQLSVSAKKAQIALSEVTAKNVTELPVGVSKNLTMSPHEKLWSYFRSQIKASSGDTEELGKKVSDVNSHFGEVSNTLSGIFPMLNSLGAVGSVAGLFEMTNKFAENTEALNLAAEKIGITTSELQKLDYAAKMTGLDTDTFNASLMKLDKNLGSAASGGNKKLLNLLHSLHINLKDVHGNVIDAAQALPGLEKAFYATSDAATKANIAQILFGKSGADMIPFLDQGSTKIAELTDQFAALGYLPTAIDKLNAAKFTDSWKQLQTAVGGFSDELGAKLSPVLTPIVDSMKDWIVANKDWISTDISADVKTAADDAKAWITSMGGMKGIGDDLKTFGGDVKDVTADLGGMKTIGEALGAYMGLKFIGQMRDAGAAVKLFTGILIDNPIGLTLTAIALASLEIYDHWDDICGAVQRAIDRFNTFNGLTEKQKLAEVDKNFTVP